MCGAVQQIWYGRHEKLALAPVLSRLPAVAAVFNIFESGLAVLSQLVGTG